MKVFKIFRYPIKGMQSENLEKIKLFKESTIPEDRAYAIVRDSKNFPKTSKWMSKRHFLQGAISHALCQINADWNKNFVLFRFKNIKICVERPIKESQKLLEIVEQAFGVESRFQLSYLKTGFTDKKFPYLSLINMETVKEIAKYTNTLMAPERYRANLWITNVPPFSELQWIGKILTIGNLNFEVCEAITRCSATDITWKNQIETDFVMRMKKYLDSDLCGLYLRAVNSGKLNAGDSVSICDP